MTGFSAADQSVGGPLATRVRRAAQEANMTMTVVEAAKAELLSTQQWSSAKSGLKGEEWFGAWAQFFEQFATAIGRQMQLAAAAARREASPAPFTPRGTPRATTPRATTPRA